MSSKDLFKYLLRKYGYENPIFLKDINIEGMSGNALKVMFKRMTEKGIIKKQAWGVYFIPKDNKWNLPSICGLDSIIEKKYISDGKNIYGYYGDTTLLNKAHISTQVPNVNTIYTNCEKTIKRTVKINKFKVILKKPYCHITNSNVKYLELLELLRSIYDDEELKKNIKVIKDYIKRKNISIKEAEKYLKYFPNRTQKRFKLLEE